MSIDEPHGADPTEGPRAAGAGRARDLLAAALALGVGAGALAGTRGMSSLGSVFPTAAAAVLIGSVLLLAARSLVRGPTHPPEAAMPAPAEWWRLAGTMLVLLLWALMLKPLGFLVTSALGVLALGPLVMREPMSLRAATLHLVAAAVLLLGFWLLMARVLRIAVPEGILF